LEFEREAVQGVRADKGVYTRYICAVASDPSGAAGVRFALSASAMAGGLRILHIVDLDTRCEFSTGALWKEMRYEYFACIKVFSAHLRICYLVFGTRRGIVRRRRYTLATDHAVPATLTSLSTARSILTLATLDLRVDEAVHQPSFAFKLYAACGTRCGRYHGQSWTRERAHGQLGSEQVGNARFLRSGVGDLIRAAACRVRDRETKFMKP
ncbi:hypothetical protein C8R45DRAFT_919289, partial [Mycena sanguinolenta]